MSSSLLIQKTETPSAIQSESVDYGPRRSTIIEQMFQRKNIRQNGHTSEHILEKSDQGSFASEYQAVLLDLPEFEPQPVVSRHTFVALHEWEGYVVEIYDELFTARLIDNTTGDKTETEEAEFPISDVATDDLDLFKVGAIFRWSIGYLRDRGTKIRGSQIVFRRLPQWRKVDLAEAREEAKSLARAIPWK